MTPTPWPPRDPDCAVCRALTGDGPAGIAYARPSRIDDIRRVDHVRGVLLGTVVGEAVGLLDHRGLRVDWNRVRPGNLPAGGAGQLAAFTAEGVLRMDIRARLKGIGPAFSVMRHALDGWMFTQGKAPDAVRRHWAGESSSWPVGWLVRRHELHRVVDGFSGTIAALGTLSPDNDLDDGEFRHRVNTSEGAGAIVRVAPIGCVAPPAVTFEVGVRNAGYTHGGASAYLGSGVIAQVVAHVLGGIDPRTATEMAARELATWPHHARTLEVVRAVLDGAPLPAGASHASRALYHGLRFMETGREPLEGLQGVASEAGTAASTVAGALWGAIHGASAFPGESRTSSELSLVIDELADAMGHIVANGAVEMLFERFPGG